MRNLSTITIAAAMIFAAACADRDPSAAQRLHDQLVHANGVLDSATANGRVMTADDHDRLLGPIYEATGKYREELDRSAGDPAYMDENAGLMSVIADEYRELSIALGFGLAGYETTAETECGCEDEGTCPSPSPSPPASFDVPYRNACIGAAYAAYTACSALCIKKCVLNPSKMKKCIAACSVGLAVALDACSDIDNAILTN